MTDTPDDDTLPPEGVDIPDADVYGRAIPPGLGLNLLVTDIAATARWHAAVLGARVVCRDADFAILETDPAAGRARWMLHHDRTYRHHPLFGIATGADGRGAGAELRLFGRDPDAAQAAAEALGGYVLAGAADKPHGVREAFLLDPDGYCWVPSVPLSA